MPVRILVVEDEYFVALELERWLAQAGHEVVGTVASAAEALELARATRPALIIMDIRLTGEPDGVEAALGIFAELGIRCLFASAHVDKGTQLRAAPARPLGWVQKPYGTQTLLHAVQLALQRLRE